MRNSAVECVANSQTGERLVFLVDWSEKLSLEPNSGQVAGTYVKVGLLIVIGSTDYAGR